VYTNTTILEKMHRTTKNIIIPIWCFDLQAEYILADNKRVHTKDLNCYSFFYSLFDFEEKQNILYARDYSVEGLTVIIQPSKQAYASKLIFFKKLQEKLPANYGILDWATKNISVNLSPIYKKEP
jgi:hypothetical protein